MRSYQYPADFTPAEEGGFVISFPDVPEAITQGETPEQCIEQASDALEEAIIGRINTGEEIPLASEVQRGQFLIPVPAQTAFKAALYEEIRNQGLNKVEMAARLGIDEKEARRLLDPHHPSKLPRIAEILERVGKYIVVGVEDRKEITARAC
ncbi:MAG: type II toxin-antitoxin system HicB family antitoxin [Acidobacteriota bacterium]|nr:type II toxin-antitoxin system HicB family antitoxin [Acidobacteriota bacterium]